ncbi:hypothetical protein VNO77_03870 [Canavalia gladiata]|uniref:Uncharacterized protein n=1 Tax=Canavalia gladiata TaxID=3824 RepID=A0AAN9MWB8_CANGL
MKIWRQKAERGGLQKGLLSAIEGVQKIFPKRQKREEGSKKNPDSLENAWISSTFDSVALVPTSPMHSTAALSIGKSLVEFSDARMIQYDLNLIDAYAIHKGTRLSIAKFCETEP